MRLAFVHLGFPPEDIAGGSIYAYHLANELAKLGHFVDVYTYAPKTPVPSSSDYPLHSRVKVVRLPYAFVPVLQEKFLYSLNRHLTEKYDLVQGFQSLYLTVTSAALHCRRNKIPYAITTYDLGVFSSGLTRRLRCKFQIDDVFRHMVFGTIISQTYLDVLNDWYPQYASKNSVITPGIDSSLFSPRNASKKTAAKYGLLSPGKHVLFLGRVAPSKGLEYAIEALAQMSSSKAILHVVGKPQPQYQEKLVSLCKKLGVYKQVVFHGPAPLSDLPSIYAFSGCLVLPSHTQGEGFGMVVLESLAMGTPVVTTQIVGAAYIIEKDKRLGLVVSPKDPSALAGAFASVLSAPKKVPRASIASEYSWNSIARQFDALYSKHFAKR